MEILKCINLKKQIKEKVIVQNISFSINKQDIVGFIRSKWSRKNYCYKANFRANKENPRTSTNKPAMT